MDMDPNWVHRCLSVEENNFDSSRVRDPVKLESTRKHYRAGRTSADCCWAGRVDDEPAEEDDGVEAERDAHTNIC
ncbi:hypothetical protein N7508_010146 [Penicillium antarcticum]|uniref:uncharacterized protein n=1 Tax=Penicillium antarcticum TaxID=416450 RepID=UPI00239641DF|nr:uncharacterized protein N7508_010146 [Penicillium antarcticum]KAJ5295325.1 hypothetical protein N7508_010146 [Penicillium antarcticum]